MTNPIATLARYAEPLAALSDAQLGTLTRALLQYAANNSAPSLTDKTVAVAFAFIRADIDAAAARHKQRCQTNRANANRRWQKKGKKTCPAPQPAVDTHGPQKGKQDHDFDAIISAWNESVKQASSSMPRACHLTAARRTLITARLREYSPEDIRRAFRLAAHSPWLNGQNPNHWVANIDWILNPANFTRCLEGNFNDRRNVTTAPQAPLPPPKDTVSPEESERRRRQAAADRQRRQTEQQRQSLLAACRAAEKNPASLHAKIAFRAADDGTLARLGIAWTPPTRHIVQDRKRTTI